MITYLYASIAGGVLFGFLDVLINANPFAQKMLDVYKPIARASINFPLGILIDLTYGFVIAGIFLLVGKNLPGQTPIIKGVVFGLIIWFFRVVMYSASHYMMFNISTGALLYMLTSGLLEMLVIGIIVGWIMKP